MGDYVEDRADGVLQTGLRIADGIRESMVSKGRTRWQDDQGVGLVCESRLSQPLHADNGKQFYASTDGKQLDASTDVLIGEYRPHEPTHTEIRLAGESLSTPAEETTEGDEQKRGKKSEKSDPQSWSEVRSQEECEGLRSVSLLLPDAGDRGRREQSTSSPRQDAPRLGASCGDISSAVSERHLMCLCSGFCKVDPDSCHNLALT